LPADSPLWAGIVDVAFEGARAAIAAADAIADGERFAYALSRPPGHHAGPAWLGGYCYLNNAAAAAHTLCERGMGPVAIIDVDFHFPTGTSAIVGPMAQVSLGSLHASTLDEVPWREVAPGERERFVGFDDVPFEGSYLRALQKMLDEFAQHCSAIVLSLGYDTVASDPHGSWRLEPMAFRRVGALLANTGLPVCVVQEGGYSLEDLAACSHAFATGLLHSAAIE
jgi:acetoin utilization deacetylase AcuC-like enzyme